MIDFNLFIMKQSSITAPRAPRAIIVLIIVLIVIRRWSWQYAGKKFDR